MAPCDCPSACNITSYNPDLSYAALSLDGIDLLISDHHDDIQRKYVHARRLLSRVKSSALIAILQKLSKLNQTIARFTPFWQSNVERIETSIVRRIEAGLEKIISMAKQDVEKLFVNITKYHSFYRKSLASSREWIDNQLESAKIHLKNSDYILENRCSFDAFKPLSEALDDINLIVDFINRYGALTGFGRDMDGSREYFLPQYSVLGRESDENCDKLHGLVVVKHMLARHKDETGHWSLSFLHEVDCSNKYEEIYKRFDEIHISGSKCLNEYHNYITETREWLKSGRALSYNARCVTYNSSAMVFPQGLIQLIGHQRPPSIKSLILLMLMQVIINHTHLFF